MFICLGRLLGNCRSGQLFRAVSDVTSVFVLETKAGEFFYTTPEGNQLVKDGGSACVEDTSPSDTETRFFISIHLENKDPININ